MAKKTEDNTKMRWFADMLRETYLGQRIAVLCVRYHYRGVLAEVGEDFMILSNATIVELSGPSNNETPSSEDPMNGSAIIKLDAIEIAHQVRWTESPLPGEDGYQNTSES